MKLTKYVKIRRIIMACFLLYLDFSIDALEEVEVVFLECFGGNSSDFLDHVGGDGQSLFLDVGLEFLMFLNLLSIRSFRFCQILS